MAISAAITLVPHVPLIRLTTDIVLINDRRVIGDRRNRIAANAIAFALSGVIVMLGLWMLVRTLHQ